MATVDTTSYLEALRTIAVLEPDLLRSIYVFAREHYEVDRASYHVSALLEHAPAPNALTDADLPGLLEQFDAREILHVTFGSVLTARSADGRRSFTIVSWRSCGNTPRPMQLTWWSTSCVTCDRS